MHASVPLSFNKDEKSLGNLINECESFFESMESPSNSYRKSGRSSLMKVDHSGDKNNMEFAMPRGSINVNPHRIKNSASMIEKRTPTSQRKANKEDYEFLLDSKFLRAEDEDEDEMRARHRESLPAESRDRLQQDSSMDASNGRMSIDPLPMGSGRPSNDPMMGNSNYRGGNHHSVLQPSLNKLAHSHNVSEQIQHFGGLDPIEDNFNAGGGDSPFMQKGVSHD